MSEMRPGRRTMELVDFVSRGEATLRSLRSLRRPRMGSVPRSEHALASSREFDRWGVRVGLGVVRPMATPSALAVSATTAGSTRPTRPPRGSHVPGDSCSRSIFCGWMGSSSPLAVLAPAPQRGSAPRSEHVLASLVSLAERGVHCSGRGAAEEQLCGAFCIFLHISQENRRLRLTIDHQLR